MTAALTARALAIAEGRFRRASMAYADARYDSTRAGTAAGATRRALERLTDARTRLQASDFLRARIRQRYGREAGRGAIAATLAELERRRAERIARRGEMRSRALRATAAAMRSALD